MLVLEVMSDNPRIIGPRDSLADAVEALQELDARHLPVVDEDGELVGMLSDRDLGVLLRAPGGSEHQQASSRLAQRVSDVMSAEVVSADTDDTVDAVIGAMLEHRIGAIPIVDGDGSVAGIVSYVDVLREVGAALARSPASPQPRAGQRKSGDVHVLAADVMTPAPRSIQASELIGRAIDLMAEMKIRHLPVVDERGRLTGMLSDRDLGPTMPNVFGTEGGARSILLLSESPVAKFMSGSAVAVGPDTELGDVVDTMLEQRIGAVPIVDRDGRLTGIVSYTDVLEEIRGLARRPPV